MNEGSCFPPRFLSAWWGEPLNTHKAAAFEDLPATTPTAALTCGPGSWCGRPLAFMLGGSVSSFDCAALSATGTCGLDLSTEIVSCWGGLSAVSGNAALISCFTIMRVRVHKKSISDSPTGSQTMSTARSEVHLQTSLTHLQIMILWLFGQKTSFLNHS